MPITQPKFGIWSRRYGSFADKGSNPSGSGNLSAVARLFAEGYAAAHGIGVLTGVARLAGVGYRVSAGSGNLTAIPGFAGVGESIVPLASNSVSGAMLLQAIRTKLLESLVEFDPSDPTKWERSNYVRTILRPDPEYANYKPEEGIAIFFRSPMPESYAGAGRYGLKTKRILEVHIATVGLLDEAGTAPLATTAHLDLEERVLDILLPGRPLSLQNSDSSIEYVGINTVWIDGGADIERMVRLDSGMVFSVLLFEVYYVPPLHVGVA